MCAKSARPRRNRGCLHAPSWISRIGCRVAGKLNAPLCNTDRQRRPTLQWRLAARSRRTPPSSRSVKSNGFQSQKHHYLAALIGDDNPAPGAERTICKLCDLQPNGCGFLNFYRSNGGDRRSIPLHLDIIKLRHRPSPKTATPHR
jgi:hypothetical protein